LWRRLRSGHRGGVGDAVPAVLLPSEAAATGPAQV